MSSAPLPLPDPLLTANVYCAGRLDHVLHRGVAPFWRRLREGHAEQQAYLWCVRYPRGGEHLKIRVHAPEARSSALRSSLEAAVSDALAELGAATTATAPPRPDGALPIDVEDEGTEAHADPSFLWTHYRRSAVSFGGGPLLDDDRYVALFTRCLGAGCEKALA
ncbi:MAG: lantibiotic dehydratase C-terminal domain-containing protein, partial [Byssovorax sp.]